MRIALLAALLTACSFTALFAQRAAPATLVTKQGKTIQIFVTGYDFDKLLYTLDDRGGQAQPMDAGNVVSVTYDKAISPNYLRAEGFYSGGNYDGAASFYEKAVTNAFYFWERVDAYIKRAEALRRLKRYDDALATLADMASAFPKSIRTLDALYARGGILLDAGKADKAEKVFKDLDGQSRKFPGLQALRARSLAALGLGRVYSAGDNHDGSIASYQSVFADLDPKELPAEYAQIALALANSHVGKGDAEQALQILNEVGFKPIPPESQGAAHLARAQILNDAGKKIQAFDAAVFAVLRGSSDPSVSGKARKLARALASALGKDEALSLAERKVYRSYLEKL